MANEKQQAAAWVVALAMVLVCVLPACAESTEMSVSEAQLAREGKEEIIQVPETVTDEEFFDLATYERGPATTEIEDRDLQPLYGLLAAQGVKTNQAEVRTFVKGPVVVHEQYMSVAPEYHSHLNMVAEPVNELDNNKALKQIRKQAHAIGRQVARSQKQEGSDSVEDVDSDEEDVADRLEQLLTDYDESTVVQHVQNMEELAKQGLIFAGDRKDGVFTATCEFMKAHSAKMAVGATFSLPSGLYKVTGIHAPSGASAWTQGSSLTCDINSLPYHITCRNAELEDVVKDATVHSEIRQVQGEVRNAETNERVPTRPQEVQEEDLKLAKAMQEDLRQDRVASTYDDQVESLLKDLGDHVWRIASKSGTWVRGSNHKDVIEATKELRANVQKEARKLFDSQKEAVIQEVIARHDKFTAADSSSDQKDGEDDEVSDVNRDFWRVFRRIGDAFRRAARAFAAALRAIKAAATRTWNRLKNTVVSVVRTVRRAAAAAWNTVKSVTRHLTHEFAKFGQAVANHVNNFANKVAQVVRHVGAAMKQVMHKVATFVKRAVDEIGKVVKKMIEIVKFIIQAMMGNIDVYVEKAYGFSFVKHNMDLINTHEDKYMDALTKKLKELRNKKKGKPANNKKKGGGSSSNVKLNGLVRATELEASIQPKFIFALKIKKWLLRHLKMEMVGRIRVAAALLVQVSMEWSVSKDKMPYDRRVARKAFTIGPVPVWIDIHGQVVVGASMTVRAGIQFKLGGSLGVHWRIGAHVTSPNGFKFNFKFIHHFSTERKFIKPNGFRPCASVEIEVFVRPQIAVKIYSAAGPTFSLEPYMKLVFVPAGATECIVPLQTHEKLAKTEAPMSAVNKKNKLSFYLGFRINVGVQVKIFGKELVSHTFPVYEAPEKLLFSFEIPLPANLRKALNMKNAQVAEYDEEGEDKTTSEEAMEELTKTLTSLASRKQSVAARPVEEMSTQELAALPAERDPSRFYPQWSMGVVSMEERNVEDRVNADEAEAMDIDSRAKRIAQEAFGIVRAPEEEEDEEKEDNESDSEVEEEDEALEASESEQLEGSEVEDVETQQFSEEVKQVMSTYNAFRHNLDWNTFQLDKYQGQFRHGRHLFIQYREAALAQQRHVGHWTHLWHSSKHAWQHHENIVRHLTHERNKFVRALNHHRHWFHVHQRIIPHLKHQRNHWAHLARVHNNAHFRHLAHRFQHELNRRVHLMNHDRHWMHVWQHRVNHVLARLRQHTHLRKVFWDRFHHYRHLVNHFRHMNHYWRVTWPPRARHLRAQIHRFQHGVHVFAANWNDHTVVHREHAKRHHLLRLAAALRPQLVVPTRHLHHWQHLVNEAQRHFAHWNHQWHHWNHQWHTWNHKQHVIHRKHEVPEWHAWRHNLHMRDIMHRAIHHHGHFFRVNGLGELFPELQRRFHLYNHRYHHHLRQWHHWRHQRHLAFRHRDHAGHMRHRATGPRDHWARMRAVRLPHLHHWQRVVNHLNHRIHHALHLAHLALLKIQWMHARMRKWAANPAIGREWHHVLHHLRLARFHLYRMQEANNQHEVNKAHHAVNHWRHLLEKVLVKRMGNQELTTIVQWTTHNYNRQMAKLRATEARLRGYHQKANHWMRSAEQFFNWMRDAHRHHKDGGAAAQRRHMPEYNRRVNLSRHYNRLMQAQTGALRSERDHLTYLSHRLQYLNGGSHLVLREHEQRKITEQIKQLLATPAVRQLRHAAREALRTRATAMRNLIRVASLSRGVPREARHAMTQSIRDALVKTRSVLDRDWEVNQKIVGWAKQAALDARRWLSNTPSPHVRADEERRAQAHADKIHRG